MSTPLTSHDRIGVLFAIVGAILFSAKGVLIKFAYDDGLSTIAVISLRMIFSLPVFAWVAWHSYRKTRKNITRHNILMVTLCGVLSYYVATWLSFFGLHFISIQLERLILFSYPALVIIGVSVLHRSFPSARLVAAAVLIYLGILLVFGHELQVAPIGDEATHPTRVLIGAGLVGFSAISFTIYVILSKPLITKLGSALFTGLSMSVSAIAVLIHAMIVLGVSADTSGFVAAPRTYGYVFIIGIAGTVLPALMLNEAIGRIGPSQTAILGTTGPCATSLLAVIFLGEAFTVFHTAALVFSVAGVVHIARTANG